MQMSTRYMLIWMLSMHIRICGPIHGGHCYEETRLSPKQVMLKEAFLTNYLLLLHGFKLVCELVYQPYTNADSVLRLSVQTNSKRSIKIWLLAAFLGKTN